MAPSFRGGGAAGPDRRDGRRVRAHAGRLGGGTDPACRPGRRFVRPGIAGGGSVSVAESQLDREIGRLHASADAATKRRIAVDPDSRALWAAADLQERRELVRLVVVRVEIIPGRPGVGRFDPARVRMDFTPWRRGTTSSAMTWAAPTAPLHARFGRPVSQSAWGTPPRRVEPVGAGVGNVGAGQRVPVA